jgi:hypothetical protein
MLKVNISFWSFGQIRSDLTNANSSTGTGALSSDRERNHHRLHSHHAFPISRRTISKMHTPPGEHQEIHRGQANPIS